MPIPHSHREASRGSFLDAKRVMALLLLAGTVANLYYTPLSALQNGQGGVTEGMGEDPEEAHEEVMTNREPYALGRSRKAASISFNSTFPAVNFIKEKLFTTSGTVHAIREHPVGTILGETDSWYWIDDNAKVLEVLIMPGVYERYTAMADKVLDFILDMSRDGVFLRRQAASRVTLVDPRHESLEVQTELMDYYGNVSNLEIRHGLRYHKGRVATGTHTHGFDVAFTCEGERHNKQTETFKTYKKTVTEENGNVVVRAVGRIAKLAEVEWRYVISPQSVLSYTYVDVRALQEGKPLTDVEVRVKRIIDEHDYERLCKKHKGKDVVCAPHANRGETEKVFGTDDLEWFTFSDATKDAWLHVVKDPSMHRVLLELHSGRAISFRTIFTRAEVVRGKAFSIVDLGVLTQGGLYKTMPYAQLLQNVEERSAPTDFSTSRDYGVVLNTMASFAYLSTRRQYTQSHIEQDTRGAKLLKWGIMHLSTYATNYLNFQGRGDCGVGTQRGDALAIVASIKLAILTSIRASPERSSHPQVVRTLNDLTGCLMSFQQSDGVFPCDEGEPFLECHGAGMLALAYISATYELLPYEVSRADVMAAYSRAVHGVRYKLTAQLIDGREKAQLEVIITDASEEHHLLWPAEASLFLRAMHIMDISSVDGVHLDEGAEEHSLKLKHYIRSMLQVSKRRTNATINTNSQEEFIATTSDRTSSASHPSCMLGYYGAYEDLYYKLLHDEEIKAKRRAA